MNLKIKLAALALGLTGVATSLHAQLNIPNADGSDGALVIGTNTVIDLSQATNGVWTSPSQKPGFGTYDSNQWAVVFKYSSVNIAAGATITFSNHITHAPVVWLVSGNVNISGTINLDGQAGPSDTFNLAEPGPGGFRGGGGSSLYGFGAGFGPGGGLGYRGSGYYGGTQTYGNTQLIPLIGGSGSSGGSGNYGVFGGGAGGGAILIAASGNITNNGYCHADGGYGWNSSGVAGSGSGGAIRLVANQIVGNGTCEAIGSTSSGYGDAGRIRLEANTVVGSPTSNPYAQAVLPANTPAIFPGGSAALVTILSISNQTAYLPAPTDPKATMNANPNSDDFTLVTTNAVAIRLQTLNFPTNGTVTIYIKPHNANQSTVPATCISSNNNAAIWQASNVMLPISAHTIIQARAAY